MNEKMTEILATIRQLISGRKKQESDRPPPNESTESTSRPQEIKLEPAPSSSPILSPRSHRLTPTDLSRMVICQRKVYLNYHGDPAERVPVPRIQQMLQQEGLDHERAVVQPENFTKVTVTNFTDGVLETTEAMAQGIQLIYQPFLRTDELQGKPDLLHRVDELTSKLGDYAYIPIDIKLTSRVGRVHEVQMMAYLYLLKQIQDVEVAGVIQLNDGTQHHVTLTTDFFELFDEAKKIASGHVEPPPIITHKCERCEWREHCKPIAYKSGDISLLTGMQKKVRQALQAEGLSKLADLADVEPAKLLHISGIGKKKSVQFVFQARAYMQNKGLRFGPLKALPNPSPGIYFDVESIDQRNADNSVETYHYLFGWCQFQADGQVTYDYELAEDLADEAATWQRFLARIERIPGPVFHYGNHEKKVINQLCTRHGADPQADRLRTRLVDLHTLISKNVAIPRKSLSLKEVAPWLGYNWDGDIQSGVDTMGEYKRWLESKDRQYLDSILHYNEHDCRATIAVAEWLHALKQQV